MWFNDFYQQQQQQQHSFSTIAITKSSLGEISPKSTNSSSNQQGPGEPLEGLFDLGAYFATANDSQESFDAAIPATVTQDVAVSCKVLNTNANTNDNEAIWAGILAASKPMVHATSQPVKYIAPSLMSTPNLQSQATFAPVLFDFQAGLQQPFVGSTHFRTIQGTTLQEQESITPADAIVFEQYTNDQYYTEYTAQVGQAGEQLIAPPATLAQSYGADLLGGTPSNLAPLDLATESIPRWSQAFNEYNVGSGCAKDAVWSPPARTQSEPTADTVVQSQAQSQSPALAPPREQSTSVQSSSTSSSLSPPSQAQARRASASGRQRVSMTKKEAIKELKESFGVPSWLVEGRRYQANMSYHVLTPLDMRRWRDEGHRYFEGLEPIGGGDADYLRDLLRKLRERRVRVERSSGGGGGNGACSARDRASVCEILIDLGVDLTPRQLEAFANSKGRRGSV